MEYRAATQEEVQALATAGEHPLLPLALDMHGCATQEEMNGHLEATLKRGYRSVLEVLDRHTGPVSLVGSGPSLRETMEDLTGDVFAINQAIGYLISNGIVPKWAMLWDAAEVVAEFAIPHPDVTYLVASRCHPAVFERLKDCKVLVWHAGGDHNIDEFLSTHQVDEPMINGGSAGITRAIFFANALGYTDIHIYGGDSSYSDDGKTHIINSLVPEKDFRVSVGNDPPRWFRTTPEWCAQVNEYRSIYTIFTHHQRCKLEVHGSGMLRYMHEILVAMKNHQGEDKFMQQMGIQALASQELDKAASAVMV